jgi:DNA ligase (NAD+)
MTELLGKMFGRLTGKSSLSPMLLHASDTCPECGSQLARDADGGGERPREPLAAIQSGSPGVLPHHPTEWCCPNPDCPAQVRRGLVHWCSPVAMDIAGGDEKLVALLVGRGLVRDVAELYRLRLKELAALPGLDQDSAQKFFDAITASMKREAWRVLFGLSIPKLGAAEAQLLCQHFATLDALFATGRERLMKLTGVTEIMARSLTHWSGDPVNRKLIRRLEKAGVNFKSDLR